MRSWDMLRASDCGEAYVELSDEITATDEAYEPKPRKRRLQGSKAAKKRRRVAAGDGSHAEAWESALRKQLLSQAQDIARLKRRVQGLQAVESEVDTLKGVLAGLQQRCAEQTEEMCALVSFVGDLGPVVESVVSATTRLKDTSNSWEGTASGTFTASNNGEGSAYGAFNNGEGSTMATPKSSGDRCACGAFEASNNREESTSAAIEASNNGESTSGALKAVKSVSTPIRQVSLVGRMQGEAPVARPARPASKKTGLPQHELSEKRDYLGKSALFRVATIKAIKEPAKPKSSFKAIKEAKKSKSSFNNTPVDKAAVERSLDGRHPDRVRACLPPPKTKPSSSAPLENSVAFKNRNDIPPEADRHLQSTSSERQRDFNKHVEREKGSMKPLALTPTSRASPAPSDSQATLPAEFKDADRDGSASEGLTADVPSGGVNGALPPQYTGESPVLITDTQGISEEELSAMLHTM